MSSPTLNIGVLALQDFIYISKPSLHLNHIIARRLTNPPSHPGGFTEHLYLLSLLSPSYNLTLVQIRTPAELSLVSALILPGGESTAISNLMQSQGLLEPLREFAEDARMGRKGRTIWGTCAGMIMLAKDVVGSKAEYEGIGGVDVKVVRNQWGRQAESFLHNLPLSFLPPTSPPFQAIFIRAPILHTLLPTDANTPPIEIISRIPLELLPKAPKGAEPLGPDADVVMVRQGNLVLSSFHPELGADTRVHDWWVRECAISP
ncbi:pyridoxal 5'-phosphate synthase pdxT subunit, partial [Phenoliferia sp. Uapishka_3]